jgi:hypothetical protein
MRVDDPLLSREKAGDCDAGNRSTYKSRITAEPKATCALCRGDISKCSNGLLFSEPCAARFNLDFHKNGSSINGTGRGWRLSN